MPIQLRRPAEAVNEPILLICRASGALKGYGNLPLAGMHLLALPLVRSSAAVARRFVEFDSESGLGNLSLYLPTQPSGPSKSFPIPSYAVASRH
jgi:hypothetical protein